MAFITVNAGGVDIPDGVYPVTLVEIKGPKIVTAQRGPKAGQEIALLDWVFAVDEGDHDGTQVETSTSTASGPKSKMYSYLTALFGGIAPLAGATFETTDLCGRRALATIRKDDNGWPRIENLGAMPAAMQQKGFAKATGAPAAAAGAPAPAAAAGTPLRDQVAAEPVAAGDLPF